MYPLLQEPVKQDHFEQDITEPEIPGVTMCILDNSAGRPGSSFSNAAMAVIAQSYQAGQSAYCSTVPESLLAICADSSESTAAFIRSFEPHNLRSAPCGNASKTLVSRTNTSAFATVSSL